MFATCGYYHNLAVTDTGRLYQWGKLYKHDADVKSFGMEVNLPGMNERRAKLVSKSHQSYYAADVNMSEVEESDKVTNFGTFVACMTKKISHASPNFFLILLPSFLKNKYRSSKDS